MSAVTDKKVAKPSQMVELKLPILHDVFVAYGVKVPAGIVDFETFRSWTRSEDFPGRYRVDYLKGRICIDLSAERVYSHNQVKSAFIHTIESLRDIDDKIGRFFSGRMRIHLTHADSSCEPDGMFISMRSLRSERVTRSTGDDGEVIEFEGTPDMILEIKSKFSEPEDEINRPAIYHTARVDEFWRVDARQNYCQFEILVRREEEYQPTESADHWLWSPLFQKWFQLARKSDLLSEADFRLLWKE